MKSSEAGSRGVGTGGLLLVLFVGLKLGHVITWSWLWVLSPVWVPLAFAAVLIFLMGLIAFVQELAKERRCA